jgi:hypothetical protein
MRDSYRGPAMTLGNMRALGITSIAVTCGCNWEAVVDASGWPDAIEIPALRKLLKCRRATGLDAIPGRWEWAIADDGRLSNPAHVQLLRFWLCLCYGRAFHRLLSPWEAFDYLSLRRASSLDGYRRRYDRDATIDLEASNFVHPPTSLAPTPWTDHRKGLGLVGSSKLRQV